MAKSSVASPNREILQAALQGLEAQKQKLDEQISQVRAMMGQRVGRPPKAAQAIEEPATDSSEGKTRRTLSSEARKRIAAAQKKRWANFRKTQG